MPCYNAMSFIKEALDSIVNQTYQNLEILCINDGSTDGTANFLEEYARQESKIRVIHNEENLKLIRTLNKGISFARGEYIARMDADDIAMPDRIEKQLNFFRMFPETGIVSTAHIVIAENGSQTGRMRHRQSLPLSCLFASFFYMPAGHPDVMGKTAIFRENQYLFEEHALHTEDYELWTRMLRKGVHFRSMPDYLLRFRKNPGSISHTHTDIQNTNYIRCAKMHFEEYFGQKSDMNVMQIVANRMPEKLKFSDIRAGFGLMRYIRKQFIMKNSSFIDRKVRREMRVVYLTHIFDLCWQIMKRSGPKNRFYALIVLLLHGYMLFNRNVLEYLGRKVMG